MGSNQNLSPAITSTSAQSYQAAGSVQSAQAQRDRSASSGQAAATAQATQDLLPYQVTISEEALRKAGLLKDQAPAPKTGAPAENKTPADKQSPTNANDPKTREIDNLKRIDREVRSHEQAHVVAGGGLVRGAASFGYSAGPDGKLYAVSGEVSIDSSPVPNDPQATIQKMGQVVRAALAPAQPSGQDRSVASAALKMEGQARQQVTQKNIEKMQGGETAAGQSTPAGPDKTKNTGSAKTRETGNAPKTPGAPETRQKEPAEKNPGLHIASHAATASRSTTFQTKHVNIQA